MRTKTVSVLLFVYVLTASLSAQTQNPQWHGLVEDGGGVKVVVNPDVPLYGEISLDLEEDLVIGNEDDENYMFYQVSSIAVDSIGNIYVLERGNCRIQKFNKEGRYLQTIGRKGQGPGEFEEPMRIIVDNDYRIYVEDYRRRIVQVLDRGGEFIHSIQSNDLLLTMGFLDNGNVLAHTIALSPGLNTHAVKVLGVNNEEVKSFKSFPRKVFPIIKGSMLGNPYEPMLHFCPSFEGGGVYGYSDEYALYKINSRGNIDLIIKTSHPQIPITKKDKENLVERYLDRQNQIPRKTILSRNDVEKAYVFPKNKPYFYYILQDESGRIYVQHFKIFDLNDESVSFDVFDENGVFLKVLHLPISPRIIMNGFIYKIGKDPDTEYPRIIRYKIKNWSQIIKGI